MVFDYMSMYPDMPQTVEVVLINLETGDEPWKTDAKEASKPAHCRILQDDFLMCLKGAKTSLVNKAETQLDAMDQEFAEVQGSSSHGSSSDSQASSTDELFVAARFKDLKAV